MSAIVKVGDIHKSFGSNHVLKGVSFEVNKGEMIAVIGASGSGKSTALRCIDRLETIDQGQIEVCGIRVDDPEKIGAASAYRIADVRAASAVVVERATPAGLTRPLARLGVRIIRA